MVERSHRMLGVDVGGSSVKASLCGVDGEWIDAISDPFASKDRNGIQSALLQAVDSLTEISSEPALNSINSIGLCLPGKVASTGECIDLSLNLPALNGWRFEDMISVLGSRAGKRIDARVLVATDAHAAAYDFATEFPIEGRTAAISLGTGVGLCVLDEQYAVGIGHKGIGHLGQIDVGKLDDHDRIDEHGTLNSLESYIGSRALGHLIQGAKLDLSPLNDDAFEVQALVRGLRIVHALYSPDRVVLLGGVGLAFGSLKDRLDRLVSRGLTPLAVDGAELLIGKHQYHAARGAAKLAAC
ncbi:MAG: ROK family protein [Phycisphaerales bacterium]